MTQYVQKTSTSAVTTTATTFLTIADPPPNGLAYGYVSSCTGLTTTTQLTLTLVDSYSTNVLGTAIVTMPGVAGITTTGPVIVYGPIPAGTIGPILFQFVVAAGTATMAGSTTAPVVLAVTT